jgi:hypothetical protein
MRTEFWNELEEIALEAKEALWCQAEVEDVDITISVFRQATIFEDYHIVIDESGKLITIDENFKYSGADIRVAVISDRGEINEDQVQTLAGALAVLVDVLDIEFDDEHIFLPDCLPADDVMTSAEWYLENGFE